MPVRRKGHEEEEVEFYLSPFFFFFRTCFYFVVTNDNCFTSVIGLYNRLLLKIGPFKDSGDLKITKSLLENLVFLCSV